MPRKLSEEGKSFNQLRGLGFEFESPQDEFSYQPGSGSTADGIIGLQENGVDSNPDAVSKRGVLEANPITDAMAQPFDENEKNIDDLVSGQSDRKLVDLLQQRLHDHPSLDSSAVTIKVDPLHHLVLEGEVSSEADRVRLREFAEAIVGSRKIHFEVRVTPL